MVVNKQIDGFSHSLASTSTTCNKHPHIITTIPKLKTRAAVGRSQSLCPSPLHLRFHCHPRLHLCRHLSTPILRAPGLLSLSSCSAQAILSSKIPISFGGPGKAGRQAGRQAGGQADNAKIIMNQYSEPYPSSDIPHLLLQFQATSCATVRKTP